MKWLDLARPSEEIQGQRGWQKTRRKAHNRKRKVREAGGEEISRLESSGSRQNLNASIVDHTQEKSGRHLDQSTQPGERQGRFVPKPRPICSFLDA